MANMFEQLWTPVQRFVADAVAPCTDDEAIGFECANPALQLEGWEPAGRAPSAGCVAPAS